MHKSEHIQFETSQATKIILYGSLAMSIVLAAFSLYADYFLIGHVRTLSLIVGCIIAYVGLGIFLYKRARTRTAIWMMLILYALVSAGVLFYWGINVPTGIFALTFIVILAGIMLGARTILPSLVCAVLIFCAVHLLHTGKVGPYESPSQHATLLDISIYLSVLVWFALIVWTSRRQVERAFTRVANAEVIVRQQKEALARELEKESAKLRQAQMIEIQQLYKFAMLGQSSAATLHELSNHLSILNLDISDLKQQHRNSKAIAHAEEEVAKLTTVLQQVRRRIDSIDPQLFDALPTIRRAVKDLQVSFSHQHTRLRFIHKGSPIAKIKGDPLALMQTITILLTNARDACKGLPDKEVKMVVNVSGSALNIQVTDNGPGVSVEISKRLFLPMQSPKRTGMGIGLYIAKHLIETQFSGTITLLQPTPINENESRGATFSIVIPLYKEGLVSKQRKNRS